jgi:hypothetical protein
VGLGSLLPNAKTSAEFASFVVGDLDLTACLTVMREKTCRAQAGELAEAEGMLMAQAVTLNVIFNELARRGAVNMGQYLGATDTYLRLAFRAQAQCRATLETLVEVKNPSSTAFVRQANVAIGGPQQVNNGIPPALGAGLARAGEPDNNTNRLLGAVDGARLDAATPGTPGTIDSSMETVGVLDGAAH